jgi:hypothetical protein
MAQDPEEFCPQDWQDENLEAGLYVWTIFIESAKLKDVSTSKPYLLLGAVVEEFPAGSMDPDGNLIETVNVGLRFDLRIYLSQKSRVWARYFLSKFGYPELLLKAEPPIIRSSEVQGLHGEVLIEVSFTETMMLRTDAKGFDTVGGTKDLFARRKALIAKKLEASGEAPVEEAPAKDLEEDVRQSAPPAASEPMQTVDDDPFSAFDQS